VTSTNNSKNIKPLVPDYETTADTLLALHEGIDLYLWIRHPNPNNGQKKTLRYEVSHPNRRAALLNDLKDYNLKWGYNVYWQVNPLKGPPDTSKAGRKDVARLRMLILDIDPDKKTGETPEQAKATGLACIARYAEAYQRPPTLCIDSGNGIQAFWLLTPLGDELEIGGDEAKAHELERFTRQLRIDVCGEAGGDPTVFDVCRVMRAVGSINWPTPDKEKIGRTPCVSTQLDFDMQRQYEVGQFAKAAPRDEVRPARAPNRTQAPSSTPSPARRVGLGLPVPSDVSVDDLRELAKREGLKVVEHALYLVAHGPTEAVMAKVRESDLDCYYASPSEALWATLCGLIRSGFDDDTILNVVLGRNAINAAVSDPKHAPARRYAEQQLLNANAQVELELSTSPIADWDEQPEAVLNYFNANHCVVLFDDKFGSSVLSWEDHPIYPDQRVIVAQKHSVFKDAYANLKVEIPLPSKPGAAEELKTKLFPAPPWWLGHPARRTYQRTHFQPGAKGTIPQENGLVNTFSGYAIQPIPGDHSLMDWHMRHVIAGGIEENYQYLMRTFAWWIQNPHRTPGLAMYLRGARGTGKSTVGEWLMEIFGVHAAQPTDAMHLFGKFNSMLTQTVFVFFDELKIKPHDAVMAKFKVLMTGKRYPVENKNQNISAHISNFTRLLICGNDKVAVPAAMDERRLCAFDVTDLFPIATLGKVESDRKRRAYFTPLLREVANGGLQSWFAELLNWDLGDWMPMWDVPKTAALMDQMTGGLRGFMSGLFSMLNTDNFGEYRTVGSDNRRQVATETLREVAEQQLSRSNEDRFSDTEISEAMRIVGAEPRRGGGERNLHGWRLPPTTEMRKSWDAHFKSETTWQKLDANGEVAPPVAESKVWNQHAPLTDEERQERLQ
jgi:Family of unknown function (DUF5906)